MPPHLVLSIEDPVGVATGWRDLAAGESREHLLATTPDRFAMPVSITITAPEAGEKTLWVEARDAQGRVLARGTTLGKFARSGSPTATVSLAKACDVDADCSDVLYCTGRETCSNGMCAAGENPCAANVECALSNCIELGSGDGTCDVTVDHLRCPSGSYCNPLRGCVEGEGCQEISDCVDGYVCNGDEQCINLVCAPGLPPTTNDGDVCTLDGCNDDRVANGDPAVFHVALPSFDGTACTIPGTGVPGTAGVCVAAKQGCALSECGDTVRAAGEQCDDGNDDDLDGCRTTCVLARCGDGVIWRDVEECDDGVETEFCNSDCTRARCGDLKVNAALHETCDAGQETAQCNANCTFSTCGDGELNRSSGEKCDDHNTISGDGCRSDCRKVESCGDAVVDAGEDCDDANANLADGCTACGATTWRAVAIAGANSQATTIGLSSPEGIAVDRQGNIYITDGVARRVRKITRDGAISTVVGTGSAGISGDGGAATSAQVVQPNSIVVDGLGNIYVSDVGNHRVRKVDADGIIQTVAGTGVGGFSGDGGAAASAMILSPGAIAIDGLGNLYIADTENHRIRKVTTDGMIATIGGTGTAGFSGDGGMATAAQFNFPDSLAVDLQGTIYVSDKVNARVRRITAAGIVTTTAGTGTAGFSGDNGAATSAQLHYPEGIALDAEGSLYVADSLNHRVRKIATNGIISTVAGTGTAGFAGDGGVATSAQLGEPDGLAVDATGRLYIVDTTNRRVRRVSENGTISTVAGTGSSGSFGGGAAATSASLRFPVGVAVGPSGPIYVADFSNHRIVSVTATGVLSIVAGTGEPGFTGDGADATQAQLSSPAGVAVDSLGDLYIADRWNSRVRKIDAGGVISTIAGSGVSGYSGDGGAATSASLNNPVDVKVNGLGDIYVTDSSNNRIRKVAADGTISTYAGTGVAGFSGDGGAATNARLNGPAGLAINDVGDLFVADMSNYRVRKIAAGTGVITTVAGTGTPGNSGDGGAATSAKLVSPIGIELDGAGNLYIADSSNNCIRKVAANGIISTVAGSSLAGFLGDGGLAANARFDTPNGVAIDQLGNLYIADTSNHRIRQVATDTHVIKTVAGQVDPEGMGPIAQARLADPRGLVRVDGFWLVAGGSSGTVQRLRVSDDWMEIVAGRYPQLTATLNLARFRSSAFGDVGGIAYDTLNGRIYVTESTANRLHKIIIVDADDPSTWTMADLAGDATGGSAGFMDGAAATARFRNPTGLYFESSARVLYVADTGNHVIRTINVDTNNVGTAFGTPQTLGFFGDEGVATQALMYEPQALTKCNNGDWFIADTGNNRVRRVHRKDSDDLITTVLGDGTAASFGEGSPAWTFPVEAPLGLVCDAFGNLYVSSTSTVRMLPATDIHIVDGEGPVQTIYGAPPRDNFPASISNCLTGVAVVDDTTLRVTDVCTGLLVELVRELRP